MFHNTKKHSEWFVSILKIRRKAEKQNENLSGTDGDGENCDVVQETTYTEENGKEDFMFFRTAVVN